MFANQTILNPIALIFVIIMAVLLYRLPRKFAMIPILCVGFFLTMNMRIILVGFDFTMLRLILLVAWIRILMRSEANLITLNLIDKCVILSTILSILTYTLLWGSFGAFVNRLGRAYDLISFYFISRIFIFDMKDIVRLLKYLLFISVPIAFAMTIEQITGRNIFSIFGGVPEFSAIRNGQIRAQASFAHPILAGDFGAVMFPLFAGLWWKNREKKFLVTGFITTALIVMASASSGPLVAYLGGIVGLTLWIFHKNMRIIFWAGVACLVGLHLMMKAPVWAIIMRLGTSGSSYHRFELIDQTIRHFSEWWLIGVTSTATWGNLKEIHDLADYYCRIAVDSGLIGLILFLLIISLCFKAAGKAIRRLENRPNLQKLIWCIGSSLFAHTLAFFGISYQGSALLVLYMTFAILSTISMMDFRKELLV